MARQPIADSSLGGTSTINTGLFATLARSLVDRWFLWLLAAALAAGLSRPQTLRPAADFLPQTAVVAAVMFLMAASVEASQIGRALRYPKAVLLAVLFNSLLIPLVAWPLSGWLRTDLGYGLLVAAAVPSTLTSAAVWTRQAGGNETIAVLVTCVTNASCFLVTPGWLFLTTGRSMRLDPWDMMQDLALAIVLPMLLGQFARVVPAVVDFTRRRKALLSGIAQSGILMIVFTGAVRAGDELRLHAHAADAVRLRDAAAMLAAVVGLHVVALLGGHYAGRQCGLSREERIAVGFAGSQKTLMVGLRTALGAFGGLAMLPMVAYHVCQLLVDTVVVDWLNARASRGNSKDAPADGPHGTRA